MADQTSLGRPVIVIQMMNQYADLLSGLAKELRERYGVGAILVYRGANDLPNPRRYHFDKTAFDALIDIEPALTPRATEALPSSAALAAEIATVEQRLSVKLLEAVRADRHLGHGFVVGAVYARSRYGVSADFDQSLDIALRLARTFEDLYRTHDVVAVIASISSIYGNLMIGVAEGLGIPVRLPNLTTNTRLYWAVDRHYRPEGLEEALARALARPPVPGVAVSPNELGQTARAAGVIANLPAHSSWRYLGRALYRATRRELGHRLKRRDQVYGKYLLGDLFANIIAVWRLRRAARGATPVLPTLPVGLPYVFLPLSVEPESTLMAESPSCDNQLAFIDWLAKAMPSGWRLLVKEHPAFTAPRPTGFWERVRAYPNVMVLAPLERGEDAMRGAKALAIVRSSLGFQAAALGIPVITAHPAYHGAGLPHVFTTESYREVETALRQVAHDELPPIATRIQAFQALHAVFDAVSVPIADANLIRGVAGGQAIDAAEIEQITDLLAGTLGLHQLETAPARRLKGVG